MFQRRLESTIMELLKEFRVVYLTGPRQAGKTTLAKSIASQCGLEYVALDNESIFQSAKNDPLGFIHSFKEKKLILDEFQYIPELIHAIKQVSDALPSKTKGKFFLTGSADIFKSAKIQESLPGHMARVELYPLSLVEKFNLKTNIIDLLCHQNFNNTDLRSMNHEGLARLILQGGYPEVQDKSLRGKQIWYKSYIEGRLFKDFEMLYAARGDYRSKLKSLIPYLAGLSGNLIKYSNISNDLALEDKLIKSYMEILELMFIIKMVPGFIKNKAKRLASTMPKLQSIDTGLACSLLGVNNESQLINSQYFGGLLENFVFMELVKQNTWSEEQVELLHFRDKYKHEVDIVLERNNNQLIGIEVKASATVRSQDFTGLIKLAEFAPSTFQYGVIFYSGKEILPFSQKGIELFALPISLVTGKKL